MTPLYLSVTSTWSSVGQRLFQSDFSMRSNEYLTSSAVSSPKSPLHMKPGFSLKAMWRSSVCSTFSTYSEGAQAQSAVGAATGTARRGSVAYWMVVSAPPIM